jgi:hypothetical protein
MSVQKRERNTVRGEKREVREGRGETEEEEERSQ